MEENLRYIHKKHVRCFLCGLIPASKYSALHKRLLSMSLHQPEEYICIEQQYIRGSTYDGKNKVILRRTKSGPAVAIWRSLPKVHGSPKEPTRAVNYCEEYTVVIHSLRQFEVFLELLEFKSNRLFYKKGVIFPMLNGLQAFVGQLGTKEKCGFVPFDENTYFVEIDAEGQEIALQRLMVVLRQYATFLSDIVDLPACQFLQMLSSEVDCNALYHGARARLEQTTNHAR